MRPDKAFALVDDLMARRNERNVIVVTNEEARAAFEAAHEIARWANDCPDEADVEPSRGTVQLYVMSDAEVVFVAVQSGKTVEISMTPAAVELRYLHPEIRKMISPIEAEELMAKRKFDASKQ